MQGLTLAAIVSSEKCNLMLDLNKIMTVTRVKSMSRALSHSARLKSMAVIFC